MRRHLVETVVRLIGESGLRIVTLERKRLRVEDVMVLYGEFKLDPYFPELEYHLTSGDVGIYAVEGDNAIERLNELVGFSWPDKANKNSIRYKLGVSVKENIIHSTEDETSLRRELEYFNPGLAKMIY